MFIECPNCKELQEIGVVLRHLTVREENIISLPYSDRLQTKYIQYKECENCTQLIEVAVSFEVKNAE